jgi:hypothetical protein
VSVILEHISSKTVKMKEVGIRLENDHLHQVNRVSIVDSTDNMLIKTKTVPKGPTPSL